MNIAETFEFSASKKTSRPTAQKVHFHKISYLVVYEVPVNTWVRLPSDSELLPWIQFRSIIGDYDIIQDENSDYSAQ